MLMRLARGELNVVPVRWVVHTEMQTELPCVAVLGAALCTSGGHLDIAFITENCSNPK